MPPTWLNWNQGVHEEREFEPQGTRCRVSLLLEAEWPTVLHKSGTLSLVLAPKHGRCGDFVARRTDDGNNADNCAGYNT